MRTKLYIGSNTTMLYRLFNQCFICKYQQKHQIYVNLAVIMSIDYDNISFLLNDDESFINFDQRSSKIEESLGDGSSSSFMIDFVSNSSTVDLVKDDSSDESDVLPNIIGAKKLKPANTSYTVHSLSTNSCTCLVHFTCACPTCSSKIPQIMSIYDIDT